MADNPYLAHRQKSKKGAENATSSSSEPLLGFLPRKVKGEQVRKAMEHDTNPFTKMTHTAQYKKILESRKKLPVFAQMDEFLTMFRNYTLPPPSRHRYLFCSSVQSSLINAIVQ
ncbi:hypothetical protein PM082_010925 [Marasmius tenuissimus]|nr:hypothetical protein PM082_010925 [Marasmius tenuissimus]